MLPHNLLVLNTPYPHTRRPRLDVHKARQVRRRQRKPARRRERFHAAGIPARTLDPNVDFGEDICTGAVGETAVLEPAGPRPAREARPPF